MCVKMHVRLLTRLGAECSAAQDGQEALQAVQTSLQPLTSMSRWPLPPRP